MTRLIFIVAVALAATAAAAGAGTTTYHGSFSGPVVYKGCTTTPPTTLASGTWNVALHGSVDATVSFDIFTDGRHHVSFGGTVGQVEPQRRAAFTLAIPTLAGPLTVSLTGETLTYRIAPYDLLGLSCKSVTYSGALDR